MPWFHLCSITQATKCVDTGNWVEEYYKELHTTQQGPEQEDFLGFSVGCNKGFDALHTLRMGTYDTSLTKTSWRTAMEDDGQKLSHSVCAQDANGEFELTTKNDNNKDPLRRGEVHCFEPMPQTVSRLQYSSKHLGYDSKGFTVVHAAVSKSSGTVLFDAADNQNKKGLENIGINNCASMKPEDQKQYCTEVKLLNLKEYVRDHIDNSSSNNNNNNKPRRTIHHLSIDVEGYDGDVILGAGTEVLKRVEYLEFEYNWMGSWKNQHLFDVLSYLDGTGSSSSNNPGSFHKEATQNDAGNKDELSFTCYWAGEKRLWRITGCWMRYYDIHTWSNVACVNRKLAPRLAEKMESVFRKTLSEDTVDPSADKKYRFEAPKGKGFRTRAVYEDFHKDPMMVSEPYEQLVSNEYI
mmetsp:Transcript_21794/g.48875  ORF Transcript_21794/g.48875 Transcript_21794/m.48875 type:complete len:408 (-) Transcript_21794:259-1482(-)